MLKKQTSPPPLFVLPARQRGFTIVELLIVIVVIGILAAIITVTFNGVQSRAKNTAITQGVANTVKTLAMDSVETGASPVEAYVLEKGSQLGGYGNYRGLTTHIANIDSLKSAVSSRSLVQADIGKLHYLIDEDAQGFGRVVQDNSANGYLAMSTYNSNATDNRLESILGSASGLDAKLTAYDTYQRDALGLKNIPAIYGDSSAFQSRAAFGSTGIRRVYPFIQLSTYCHMLNKNCFTYFGYYLYGKTAQCPNLGVKTKRITNEVLYNTASGGSRSHNMTFCITFIDAEPPVNYPN